MQKGFVKRCRLASSLALALVAASLPPHAQASTRPAANPSNQQTAAAHSKRRGRTLWPGSRFTEADRARATRRGLSFIYKTARDAQNFAQYGGDYLWCFYTIGASVRDAGLRRMAHRMGLERARHWRRTHASLPERADAITIADFAFGSDAADSLGLRDDKLKEQIRRAAPRFTARDFLLFDPRTEPPPSDVPDECDYDRAQNPRGATHCRGCRRPLKMRTRQDVWYDALITAYVGERYGVTLGARYADVLRWLPSLRPYSAALRDTSGAEFYDTVYALTHVVYTLNDYGQYSLAPGALPQEYEFLRANLREAIEQRDADMLGEFMDSLRAFGMSERDAEIRAGVEYLLTNQNADGSWGDVNQKDIYLRYHPTWNAVAALSQYAWRGSAPRLSEFRLILEGEAPAASGASSGARPR